MSSQPSSDAAAAVPPQSDDTIEVEAIDASHLTASPRRQSLKATAARRMSSAVLVAEATLLSPPVNIREAAVAHEVEHPRRGCEKIVLHPQSRLRIYWDAISAVLLICNSVMVPYHLSFEETHPACPEPLWVFNAFIDWFFVCDIALNFFTGVDLQMDGNISYDLKTIAKRYAMTWLVIDISSSMPIDFFIGVTHCNGEDAVNVGYIKMIRMLRLTKLLKLLRLLKLNKLLDTISDYWPINAVISKAATLIVVVFYIAHLVACAWYAVGESSYDLEGTSWLSAAGLEPSESSTGARYAASLYWAFTTMTTVGYGDLTPQTANERLFAILAMMVGASVFGYIVGQCTTLVANSDAAAAQIQSKMEGLNSYMRERAIGYSLQVKIRKYFRYFWSRRTAFDSVEGDLLADLSVPLRAELLYHVHREVIDQITLFQLEAIRADAGFVDLMVRAMKPLLCMPNEDIVSQGKLGSEMYFVIKGSVAVRCRAPGDDEPRHVADLGPGDYFGEIALITVTIKGLRPNRRTATVTSSSCCDLHSVGRTQFTEALESFPEVADLVRQTAEAAPY